MRYYCVAAKNNSETETVSALGVWTGTPGDGTAAIQSISGESITLVAEPRPTREMGEMRQL